MHRQTKFACVSILIAALLMGCNGGGDSGTTPPVNQPPTVAITSNTPDSIFYTETIEFTWQGNDTDGTISTYHAGLDGNLQPTTATTASYSGFNQGDAHTFSVIAEDNDGDQSDPASVDFAVFPYEPNIEMVAFGEGITDDDGDSFWSEFNVRWAPDVPGSNPVTMYLRVFIRTSFGSGSELEFISDPVVRSPADEDTLTYSLPQITKNLYEIRLELHDNTDSLLFEVDYGSIGSLTQFGLEEFDGFIAWFDDAWIDNGIDSNGDDYYESIELWWDVDANLDVGSVKVVVYERNSANEERYLTESYVYEVEGLGNEDANGILITAGTTFDDYDYRLVLLDESDNLLDELDYGEDPDLMDVPLGAPGSSHAKTSVLFLN